MLKLILQHWQAHRQKIAIFPDPFEPDQPITRINPIYQDTESSSTSPSPNVLRRDRINETGSPVITNVVAEIHKEPPEPRINDIPSSSGASSGSEVESIKATQEIAESSTNQMTRNKNSPVPANKSALHSNPETHAVLAQALSSTMLNNNLNLKPSEVVKRQKELLQQVNGSPPGADTNTQPKVVPDGPPVLVIPPPPPLSTIQEVDDLSEPVSGITRSENSRVSEMKLKEAAKETLKKRTEAEEASTSAAKTTVPSEDSGITRGDQAPSDEGNNSSTNHSSADSNKKDDIREKFVAGNKRFCKRCTNRRSTRQSVAVGKYDEYYLAAILAAKDNRYNRHSNDSLSDFSSDRFRSGATKVCKSCQRERRRYRRHLPSGSVSEEDFLERRPSMRKYRRASWASCSCDQCSEASLSFERKSKSLNDDDAMCTCGHENRRVKFANKANGEQPGLKPSISKTSLNSPDTKNDANNLEAKTNIDDKKKNGFAKKPEYSKYPWELEDWQGYLRKRQLKQRRRRAFYMGLMALVMIIIIGMAVGLVLTWLRRR